ncbi:hypothetical protein ACYOEI_07515 [Singulisphaera rosea]
MFHLAPLDHHDLEGLYHRRMLPIARPLRSRLDNVIFDGSQNETQAAEALYRVLESFRAILETSLRKAQPWLTRPKAEVLVAMNRGDAEDSCGDVTLFRQVQRVGKLTLDGLVSHHRGRLAELISLAAAFEAVATMPWDGEDWV